MKEAAGDRDVAGLGGADVRRFLGASLVDELRNHLVPIFPVGGTRHFDALGGKYVGLEPASADVAAGFTHVTYRPAHEQNGRGLQGSA